MAAYQVNFELEERMLSKGSFSFSDFFILQLFRFIIVIKI